MSVDAINERLHGLVTLLQAVGVDSVGDANGANKVSKGDISLPDTRQLNDDQIELIIKKLQLAQTEAPQLIQELQKHADARSIQGGDKKTAEKEDEDDDEDEEDDEFDEDANYPMVGGGCSDDISVVSDLTTPTVLQGSHVPEEEHYRETLPPMMIGGGGGAPSMLIQAPKQKNKIQASRASMNVQPMGGRRAMGSTTSTGSRPATSVAEKRRREYAEAMAKIQEASSSEHSSGGIKPLRKPGTRSSADKTKTAEKTKTKSSKPKTKKTGHSSLTDFGNGSNRSTPDWATPSAKDQWAAFDSKPKPSTNIDNNGFLVGGESFDPFGTGNGGGFSSSAGDLAFSGPTSRSRKGDDGFGSQHSGDGHQASSHSRGNKPRKPRAEKKPGAPEGRRRQPRRASTIT